MKVTFILQLFCIKDPMAYVYLQIGPYSYLRAYFPYNTKILTPNIIFFLGFKATFQSTHHTLKGLYCIEITNTPLALCTTHTKHAYFTLEFRVYIPYYLNVTVHNIVHTGIGDKTRPIPYLCCILLACEVELDDTEGSYSSCTRVRFLG
jgi:hypothetical protein